MKGILRDNGFQTHNFSHHLDDIPNMVVLIRKTTDLNERKSLIFVLVALVAGILLSVLAFVLLLKSLD